MIDQSGADAAAVEGAEILLLRLGTARPGEKVIVVADDSTGDIAELMGRVAKEHGIRMAIYRIEPLRVHGQEPPSAVAAAMRQSSLVLGLTHNSMAHTRARQEACRAGARYLSLPDYSWDLLRHPALRIDYRRSASKALVLAKNFTKGSEVRVRTRAGTDIRMSIRGRTGNFCPGYVEGDLRLGSPPDIEANVSPVEDASEGQVVVDASIPLKKLGRLRKPVTLTVENGKITRIHGSPKVVGLLEELFKRYGPKARTLAECGVGFNERAKPCGNMLLDEGSLGTIHFGFGSNSTVGGLNEVNFHLDFVFYASEIVIDGKRHKIS